MKRAGLAATIKARWICEQAHQQLKEKLGLDHFEGRSWQGLHRHALMTMIAYAFLQHRHLTQVGRKKESTDRRLSLACRPYATPSSISFFDHYLSNAHTAEDEAVKNSGVGKSAKVVLVTTANEEYAGTGTPTLTPQPRTAQPLSKACSPPASLAFEMLTSGFCVLPARKFTLADSIRMVAFFYCRSYAFRPYNFNYPRRRSN
jgi:Transposase DDE domain